MLTLSDLSYLDIFFAWLSLVSITLFLYATLSLRRVNKKLEDVKENESRRWQEIEEKAQKDYQGILQTANKKAQEILFQATQIKHESALGLQNATDGMIQNQTEALKQVSDILSKKHEEEINRINEENIKILINIYKDIEESAKTDFANYKKIIQQQTFEAEKIAQDRIRKEYEKLESEIQDLKQKKLQELNDNIYNFLSKISKEVIGKSLNMTEHEDLVVKALDKAKKEGIL